jgi:hypothetical protein
MSLATAIASGDEAKTLTLLENSPELATARFETGATRASPEPFFLESIRHYIYAGDTALHIAAAAHRPAMVRRLLEMQADVRAKNRRGAEPLHYAVDGGPGAESWRPHDQATVIKLLLKAGADPNAPDGNGTPPLHRAARNRCSAAVKALLAGGADVRLANKSGSTPLKLATQTTGRGGSGSPEAKSEQEKILRLLNERGAQ